MADLNITPSDVREYCPDLIQSDSVISMMIAAVGCKVDTCLESSYAECMDVARLIKINTVCHIGTLSGRAGQVKSRKYANGASESYGNYVDGGRGLNGSQFGEVVLMLDTEQCINKAFPASARQFIVTAGTAGSRSTGYQAGES